MAAFSQNAAEIPSRRQVLRNSKMPGIVRVLRNSEINELCAVADPVR